MADETSGTPQSPDVPPVSPAGDRTLAMLCHLLGIFTGFIGALIIWLIKKDEERLR
jgi:uncharacterized protein